MPSSGRISHSFPAQPKRMSSGACGFLVRADHQDLDERPKELGQTFKAFTDRRTAQNNYSFRLNELSTHRQQRLSDVSFVLTVNHHDDCRGGDVAMRKAPIKDRINFVLVKVTTDPG
jgi:hypothetical protein